MSGDGERDELETIDKLANCIY
uniref:Uncharacterized protein n=1 Tax=Arundo donax TaxID=35708 RepID=A0A0A9B1W5_ARUDO